MEKGGSVNSITTFYVYLFLFCREFLGDCLFSTKNRKPYELPWQQKILWSLLFGIMLVIAISGNCIVLWIVLGKVIIYMCYAHSFLIWNIIVIDISPAHRRMRTVTNYFLLNLSITDLLMATLNCVFNLIFMIDSGKSISIIFRCRKNNQS
jgi:tachykinin-like receptor